MQLTGIHHLTAVTADAPGNHRFYTQVLGLRMVKKTVNQDDTSAYHLFYADGEGSPGTDITFFDWPTARERRGSGSIARTALRVGGAEHLDWWASRLREAGVFAEEAREVDGRWTLRFEDPEGQRLALVDDGGAGESRPWARSPVPAERQIRGLGPITLSLADAAATERVLTHVLGMREARRYGEEHGEPTTVFEMGEGGPAAELHLRVEPGAPRHVPGAGGVHHVAFRIPDGDYQAWTERLAAVRLPSSGPVDRFWVRSLDMREPGGILFEIATDGPGFGTDEPMDRLGETLSLPPFLEGRRAAIEAGLKPLGD